MIIQFSMCLLVLMKDTIERQNKQDNTTKQLYGCLNKCDIMFGYFMLLFLLHQTCTTPLAYTLEMLLINDKMVTLVLFLFVLYFIWGP